MAYDLIPYKTPDDWHKALVKLLSKRIKQDLEAQGSATLSLAGGNTPLSIYRKLAAATDIEWSHVTVIPGDDRCVPHDHTASNFAQLRQVFAVSPVEPITEPDGGTATDVGLQVMLQHPGHFTATVLGMGADLHTASLFPHADGLAEAIDMDNLRDIVRITPEPLPSNAPYVRITMTVQRLLRARKVVLMIKGQDKRDALMRALELNDPLQAPVMAVLNDEASTTEIHWCP